VVRGFIGHTDAGWWRSLSASPELSEVNFWRPGGGRAFHVLEVGEPFFFKTHAPHNRVVGGGFYSGFAAPKVSEAWEFHGHANGVDLSQMRGRIGLYRRQPIESGADPVIGCKFVRDVSSSTRRAGTGTARWSSTP